MVIGYDARPRRITARPASEDGRPEDQRTRGPPNRSRRPSMTGGRSSPLSSVLLSSWAFGRLGSVSPLQSLRPGMPDGHRHPPGAAARVHRLRGLHRCVRRGDDPGGAAEGPHPLRFARGTLGRRHALAPDAHDRLRRAAARRRRGRDLRLLLRQAGELPRLPHERRGVLRRRERRAQPVPRPDRQQASGAGDLPRAHHRLAGGRGGARLRCPRDAVRRSASRSARWSWWSVAATTPGPSLSAFRSRTRPGPSNWAARSSSWAPIPNCCGRKTMKTAPSAETARLPSGRVGASAAARPMADKCADLGLDASRSAQAPTQ